MSDNISKKLAIKAELLRHLSTATRLHEEGKPSSGVKVRTLMLDIYRHEDDRFFDTNLEVWRAWLV